MSRKYLFALLAGLGMFGAVYLIDALLANAGLHAEDTHLDDLLLGILAAAIVFFLQRQHERELLRQRQRAALIEQMNHHIRNALQVIVYRTNLDMGNGGLLEIKNAVDRIDWALREILPQSDGKSSGQAGDAGKRASP